MMPDVCCLGHRCFFSLHVSYAKLLTNVLLYINENKKEPKQHQTCVGEAEGDLSPSPEQSDNAMSRTKEVVLVIKLQTPIYG